MNTMFFRSNPKDYQVRVGSSYNQNGGYIYQVADLIWHPDFSYAHMDSDVALLWLATPMTFTDSVAPIEMLNADDEIIDGDFTLVTGWGHMRVRHDNKYHFNMYMRYNYCITIYHRKEILL